MSSGAYVGSIDALREFRGSVNSFLQEARDAMVTFDLELRRTMEWLDGEAQQHWAMEVRKREDQLAQARVELEKARNTKLPNGEPKSTVEERKAYERAQRRKQFAEDKLKAMKRWSGVAKREAIEYAGRANPLNEMLDTEIPVALAMLDRALIALESYANLQGSGPAASSGGSGGIGGSMASALKETETGGPAAAATGSAETAGGDAAPADVAATEAEPHRSQP